MDNKKIPLFFLKEGDLLYIILYLSFSGKELVNED